MKAGRKTKLTPELKEKLVRLIRVGNFANVAAAACGIARDTFYKWLKRGGEESHGIYRELVDEIHEAAAVAEARNVAMIQQAGSSSWQAAAWYLERRSPDRWGRSQSSGVNADESRGAPLQKQPTILYQGPALSDEALRGIKT